MEKTHTSSRGEGVVRVSFTQKGTEGSDVADPALWDTDASQGAGSTQKKDRGVPEGGMCYGCYGGVTSTRGAEAHADMRVTYGI